MRTGIAGNKKNLNTLAYLEITDNRIFHTKGGILFKANNDSNFMLNTAIITGNSWTSTDEDSYLSHNEWDIVYWTNEANKFDSSEVLAPSLLNNNAYVLNRMSTGTVTQVTRNRSHAFVVFPDDLEDFKDHINPNVYVTSQETNNYNENSYSDHAEITGLNDLSTDPEWYLDIGSGDTGDRGGNRDFYWKPAESIEMAYEAIVYGGKIMVWDSETHSFIEHTIDWNLWENVTIPPKSAT